MIGTIVQPPIRNVFQRLWRNLCTVTSREAWFNNFGIAICLFSLVLGIATYAILTDNIALSNKLGGFYWLLGVDVVLLLALCYALAIRARDVWRQRKKQMAGARLHIQLMTIFSALAAIPALIVAVFAVTFIQIGVQSWFGENIRTAVTESQEIAKSYLQEHQQTIRADMLAMAGDLNREAPRLITNREALKDFFRTQAYLRNLSEAVMLDGSGRILARAGLSLSFGFLPDNFADMIRQADKGGAVLFMGENEDRVRALVKLDNFVDTYLFVGRFVDENVLTRISATNRAADVYHNLEKRQASFKFNMTLIFVLVDGMLLLVALWTGLTLAERIVAPVTGLIKAAELVREGDFNTQVAVGENMSEIGTLGRAFNRMIGQLGTQRGALVNANTELDERRRFIEAVLGGVSAGIIGMDDNGVIQIINASAQRLLGVDAAQAIGHKLADICHEMEKVRRVLRSKQQMDIELPIDVSVAGSEPHHWVVRMTAEMRGTIINGYVATFDDLSALIDAQRKAAWSDVARRVAHEIKNPLTPIQLAAERLKRKYARVITEDRDTFEQCTDTIIRQVDDIRHMVDEFSAFARMPTTSKRTENLVTLCQQVLVLFQQGTSGVTYRFQRPDHAVTMLADRQQLAQVLTNLVKNASEAIAETGETGEVVIMLEDVDDAIKVSVGDNGPGWPPALREKLLEPYITTKDSGSGLGLAIVAKIVEDHGGQINLSDNVPHGALVAVTFKKGDMTHGA